MGSNQLVRVKLRQYVDFASGKVSPKQALMSVPLLSGDWVEAKYAVGLETPLLALTRPAYRNIANYIFPDAAILTEPSRTSFHGKWHLIAFEGPEHARMILKSLGINFFLIDFATDMPIFGAIPCSNLFSPDHIGEYFDIFWKKGTIYVLTWKGNGTEDINNSFIDKWHRKLTESQVFQGLFHNVKVIYEMNRGRELPIKRPFNLPRVPGW